MSFLTIRIETPDGPAPLDPNRGHTLRKAVASLLELELGRDFESVTVVPHDEPPTLVFHVRAPFGRTKLSSSERKFLDDLNEMLADSAYGVAATGAVYRRDTQVELSGVGVDWRAVMRTVHQQGPAMLPGVVASVIDAAEEYEKNEAAKRNDG